MGQSIVYVPVEWWNLAFLFFCFLAAFLADSADRRQRETCYAHMNRRVPDELKYECYMAPIEALFFTFFAKH